MAYPVCDLDFETEPVVTGSPKPPKPVGYAEKVPGGKAKYWAFGHPSGNNCTFVQAKRRYKELCHNYQIAAHYANFDTSVGEEYFGVKPIRGTHCTMVMGFLDNPHAQTLELKEVAATRYGMPPVERDSLKQWIFDNIPGGKKKPSEWARFICQVPGSETSKYAIGDIARSGRMRRDLMKSIVDQGMEAAYAREIRLIPILNKMTKRGMPVSRGKLAKDIRFYEKDYELNDVRLRRRLKIGESVNLDSPIQLADALERAGVVDEWIVTPTGLRSTSIPNLKLVVKDPNVMGMLSRRSLLDTYLNTFMKPWMEYSMIDGRLHFTWNGTRRSDEEERGARTGRLSSTPNLQNVPKEPPPGYPFMRNYLIPERSQWLLVRDYSQQEFRILAHYVEGALLESYQNDPNLDMHDWAQGMINALLSTNFERKPIKNTGFAVLYGAGGGKVAEMTGQTEAMGRTLKRAYLKGVPGLKDLIKLLTETVDRGEKIRTWGGRLYPVEPGRYIKGFWRTFQYKMLNVLIQGSAADCTKEAMINADDAGLDQRFSIHDELGVMTEPGMAVKNMECLREAMEAVKFDLPMLSDGKYSRTSYGSLVNFDPKRIAQEVRQAA